VKFCYNVSKQKLDKSCFQHNKKCFPNQPIMTISEGSGDTEDWSNDAENLVLPSQEYITF